MHLATGLETHLVHHWAQSWACCLDQSWVVSLAFDSEQNLVQMTAKHWAKSWELCLVTHWEPCWEKDWAHCLETNWETSLVEGTAASLAGY